MSKTNWLNSDEARMWRAFIEMSHHLDVALDRQLVRDAGLSGADYALLVPLSETADSRLRARELGRIVSWDRSRLSHQLRRMEERCLIRRVSCEEDARGTVVELTEAGRQAINQAAPSHVETVRRLFVDELSAGEMATLTRVATRVMARIADESNANDNC